MSVALTQHLTTVVDLLIETRFRTPSIFEKYFFDELLQFFCPNPGKGNT